jgi:aminoglycoside phosphotransferase
VSLDVQALDAAFPSQKPWEVIDHFAGGSQGAALVTDGSGTRFVAKRHGGAPPGSFQANQARTKLARAHGVPAPEMEVASDNDGVLLLLEHLPGVSGTSPSPAVVQELLAVVDRLQGLGDPNEAQDWRDVMRESLTEGLSGYCEHGSLRDFSPESHALLARIQAATADIEWSTLPADDLVHYDFHPGNVLVDADRVTGIVDWDGSRTGDGLLDVASLAFCTSFAGSPEVVDQLWSAFHSLGDEQRRSVALHHIVLRLADWCIRFSPTAEAQHVVATGHRALQSLAAGGWQS